MNSTRLNSSYYQNPGLEQLTASIIAALQSANRETGRRPSHQQQTQTGGTSEPNQWRQWNQYCWSCGVQLNHNSATCKRPRSGHEEHLTATFNDQQGGNDKRNHLWEKWCGPDIGIYQMKGDTVQCKKPITTN